MRGGECRGGGVVGRGAHLTGVPRCQFVVLVDVVAGDGTGERPFLIGDTGG